MQLKSHSHATSGSPPFSLSSGPGSISSLSSSSTTSGADTNVSANPIIPKVWRQSTSEPWSQSKPMIVYLTLPKSVYIIGETIVGAVSILNCSQLSFSCRIGLYGSLTSTIFKESFLEQSITLKLNPDSSNEGDSILKQEFVLSIPIQFSERKKTPPSSDFPVGSIIYFIRAEFFVSNIPSVLCSLEKALCLVDEGKLTILSPLDIFVEDLDVRFQILQNDGGEVYRPGSTVRCRVLFDQPCTGKVTFSMKLNCSSRNFSYTSSDIIKQTQHIDYYPAMRNELGYQYGALSSDFVIPTNVEATARTLYSEFYYTVCATLKVMFKDRLIQQTLEPPLQIPISSTLPSPSICEPISLTQEIFSNLNSPKTEGETLHKPNNSTNTTYLDSNLPQSYDGIIGVRGASGLMLFQKPHAYDE